MTKAESCFPKYFRHIWEIVNGQSKGYVEEEKKCQINRFLKAIPTWFKKNSSIMLGSHIEILVFLMHSAQLNTNLVAHSRLWINE